MATTYYADIQALYVAYFNRPADYAGLQYWETVVEANKGSTAAVSAAFAASDEYKTAYAGKDAYAVVAQIYQNLFGHEADVAGLTFWANGLINGTFTIDNAVTSIAAGAQGTDLTAYNNKVTAAAAFTNALTTTSEIVGYSGTAANDAAKTFLSGVTDDASLAAAIDPTTLKQTVDNVAALNPINAGSNYTLTIGADTFNGTSNNDTFTAGVDHTSGLGGTFTLTGLDKLNGGGGNDKLIINDDLPSAVTIPSTVTLTSIENVVITAAGDVNADFSGANVTGLTNLTVSTAANVAVLAGETTDVNVSGATGTMVAVGGGQNVTVTSAGGQDIVVGADFTGTSPSEDSAASTGTVTITDTALANGEINVIGGTDVTVTASGVKNAYIAVGFNDYGSGSDSDAVTGAVNVTSTGAAYAAADSGLSYRGEVYVTGGTTVNVTESAYASTTAAAKDTSIATVVQGYVEVDGTADTTSVTIKEDAAVDAVAAVAAVTGVKEVDTVAFIALAQGESITIGGLTFTAAKALTAAQVAAAFSGLASGATFGTAAASSGSYSGTLSGFSLGTVTTTGTTVTVDATAKTAATASSVIVVSDTAAAGNVSSVLKSGGTTAISGVTGVAGVIGGSVDVFGHIDGKDVLTTVSLDGYGAGSRVYSDALTSLTLANSDGSIAIDNASSTTLALGLDNVGADSVASVAIGSTYTTLNITASTDDSAVVLGANAVQTLTVGGDATVDLTGTTLASLKTVTVTGSAGLTVDASSATVTAVDTTGTTGTVTASINASKATYTGGAGSDIVTLTSTTVSKAIATGAGNDTVNLAAGTTSLAATIDGGDGTDTLGMTAADAASVTTSNTFASKITGFEKLSLGAVASGSSATVDLANLNNISYVVSKNSPTGVATSEVQQFTITSGSNAATGEQQTFTVTGNATAAGNITVAGTTITLTGTETIDQIGVAIAGATYSNPAIDHVDYNTATNTVTITYTAAAGDVAAAAAPTAGATGATFGAVVDNAVAYDSNAGTVTVAGVTINVTAGESVDAIGGAFVAASTPATTFAYDSTTHAVTITYASSAGDVADASIVNISGTGATFSGITDVTQGASGASGSLTLKNMADAGTLELTAAGGGATVVMADATGTSDSFNIVTKLSTASLNYGNVTVAGVESITLTSTDTKPTTATGSASIDDSTIKITDAALKSLVLTGNANLHLTLDATDTAVTTIDGSAATGKLDIATVAGAAGSAGAVVTGGSAADTLLANHAGDTLIGGAGNDTLTANADQVTLTGGAGSDTFVIGSHITNVNAYATITDVGTGDMIKFAAVAGTSTFASAAVSLGDTAVFQDYANAAINASHLGNITWFQFGGNTYVVENESGSTSFVNGSDVIVKLAGTVDLSTAAFNSANHALLIG